MYHLVLVNITLTNLLVCTIVKPITGIYVAYAYARVSNNVLRSPELDMQYNHR